MKTVIQIIDAALVLITVIFLLALCSGCTLVPPAPEEVTAAARCKMRSVETSDAFTWRFLGFSSNRSTKVECE